MCAILGTVSYGALVFAGLRYLRQCLSDVEETLINFQRIHSRCNQFLIFSHMTMCAICAIGVYTGFDTTRDVDVTFLPFITYGLGFAHLTWRVMQVPVHYRILAR